MPTVIILKTSGSLQTCSCAARHIVKCNGKLTPKEPATKMKMVAFVCSFYAINKLVRKTINHCKVIGDIFLV